MDQDPTMRNWLNDARSYMEPIKIGGVMRAGGIGRVIASKSPELKEGDLVSLVSFSRATRMERSPVEGRQVFGSLGWQEYWTGPASKVQRRQ